MKSKELYLTFDEFFKDDLLKLGFKKKANKYIYTYDDDLQFEVNIQVSKWGWFEDEGSKFTYSTMPIYKKWSVLDIIPIQIRFDEVTRANDEVVGDMAERMNRYLKKLPKSRMKYLVKMWTKSKVRKEKGSWFFYFDLEDVVEWQKILKPTVIAILKEDLSILSKINREKLESSINKYADHETIYVDPSSGKVTRASD